MVIRKLQFKSGCLLSRSHVWSYSYLEVPCWVLGQGIEFSNLAFIIGLSISSFSLFALSPLSFGSGSGAVILILSLKRNLNLSLLDVYLVGNPLGLLSLFLLLLFAALTSLILAFGRILYLPFKPDYEFKMAMIYYNYVFSVSPIKICLTLKYLLFFICKSWVWHTECSGSTLRELALSHSCLIQQLNFVPKVTCLWWFHFHTTHWIDFLTINMLPAHRVKIIFIKIKSPLERFAILTSLKVDV